MSRIFIILFIFINFIYADVKILSFNVENLFDGKNDGSEYKDFRIGSSDWSEQKYESKIHKLAKFLQDSNADIIGLQEIENYNVLKSLANLSGYKYFEFSKDNSSPVGVALMSKIPIYDHKFYRPVGFKSRDILECDFKIDDEKISVFVVHLLAPKNPFRKRRANFNLLYDALSNTKNAIVIGDFNAKYKDKIFDDLLNLRNLIDLWKFDESEKSHPLGKIDHALLSDSFFKNQKLNYKMGSFRVLDNEGLSDHHPIEFSLSLTPQKFDNSSDNLKDVTIDEIYNKNISNVMFKDVVVTYKDKNGFCVGKNHRGVYIHSDYDAKVGDVVDVYIKKTGHYKGNFQISWAEITKKSFTDDLNPYTLSSTDISRARSGDVISSISGKIIDKKMNINGVDIKIFNHKTKWYPNGDYTFKNVFFTTFKNEPEIIVP